MKPNSGTAPGTSLASAEELRHFLGDLDDTEVAEILALRPTVDQVEQSAMWLAGNGDRLSREGHAMEGVIAAIYDILSADEDEDRPA